MRRDAKAWFRCAVDLAVLESGSCNGCLRSEPVSVEAVGRDIPSPGLEQGFLRRLYRDPTRDSSIAPVLSGGVTVEVEAR